MSIVQIFPRAEEPSAQVLSVNPVVEPGASTTSPEPPAGMPVAADPLPVSEPYPLDRAFHAMLARLNGRDFAAGLVARLARLELSSRCGAAASGGDVAQRPSRHGPVSGSCRARNVAKAVVRDCSRRVGIVASGGHSGKPHRSICLRRRSCLESAGGTMPRPAYVACRTQTRPSSNSRCVRCSTCWRRRISRRPIRKCWRRRSGAAGRISCSAGRTGAAT